MLVMFGSRMFGKTDVVPGVCHVVTKFFHINFLPLIPLESYVVVAGSEKGDGFKGKQIPMSFKSVLIGWVRAAAFLTGVFCGVMLLVALTDNRSHALTQLVVTTAVSWSAFIATYRFGKASVPRSIYLARELGISEELLEKAFGADALEMVKHG